MKGLLETARDLVVLAGDEEEERKVLGYRAAIDGLLELAIRRLDMEVIQQTLEDWDLEPPIGPKSVPDAEASA